MGACFLVSIHASRVSLESHGIAMVRFPSLSGGKGRLRAESFKCDSGFPCMSAGGWAVGLCTRFGCKMGFGVVFAGVLAIKGVSE